MYPLPLKFTLRAAALPLSLLLADTAFAAPAMVVVGDPGNAGMTVNTISRGAVSYTYAISKYEVTNAQYAEFLNSVARTADTHALYNSNMGSDRYNGGIVQQGTAGNYNYVTRTPAILDPFGKPTSTRDFSNMAVNRVCLYDAMRYVNWLNNGANATADTETGMYSLATAAVNLPQARVVPRLRTTGYAIASANEWFKAAYYKGGSTNAGYWTYATKSDTLPSMAKQATAVTANQANYGQNDGTGYNLDAYARSDVGKFTTSASAYGTYDQGGSVWEMTDSALDWTGYIKYGGSFLTLSGDSSVMQSTAPINLITADSTATEGNDLGFRIVYIGDMTAIPEPATYGLLGAGVLSCLVAVRRRRRQAR